MSWKRRRGSRGTASVEAVIALPVFVVIFVGLFYLRDLTAARLAADQEVRRCSWQYALRENCKNVPEGCGGVVGDPHHGELMPDVEGVMNDLTNTMGSVGVSCSSSGCSVGGKAFEKVKRVLQNFVLSYLSQAVSVRIDANKSVELARPPLFGGGVGAVNGAYGIACNIQPKTEDDVIQLLWNEFGP